MSNLKNQVSDKQNILKLLSKGINHKKIQEMEQNYNFDKELNSIAKDYLNDKIAKQLTETLESAFNETTNNKYIMDSDIDSLSCSTLPDKIELYDKSFHSSVCNGINSLSQAPSLKSQQGNLQKILTSYKKYTDIYFKYVIKTDARKKAFLSKILTIYAKLKSFTRVDFPLLYKKLNDYKKTLAKELVKYK